MVERDAKRPPNVRLNSSTVESPFFPDWSLVGCDRITVSISLKPVLLTAERGRFRWNAHLYAHGKLIGYVTSEFGDSRQCAIGYIRADLETNGLDISFRNPGSINSFILSCVPVKITSTESSLLGMTVV
jgi:hypothetical protein